MRSHCPTQKKVKKPTLQEKSRMLIGKTELFRDENCSVLSTSTDVDQVHHLGAISSALLVLKTEQPFFLFVYLFVLYFF